MKGIFQAILVCTVLTGSLVTGSAAQVRLAWDDTSSNEDGFRLYRRTGSGTQVVHATLPANTITFTDTAVSAGNTYSYSLSAFNAAGESDRSAEVSTAIPSANSGAVQFVGTDTVTAGNWKGKYGSQGYNVIYDHVNYPPYANVAASGNSSWRWDGAATREQALLRATTSARIAACWYSASSFTTRVFFSDNTSRRVTLHCLDWDNLGRKQKVEVLDANTGAILSSQRIENFQGGVYLTWNIVGAVAFRVTAEAGNAVLSGIFFDGISTTSGASSTPAFRFNGVNTTRGGSWKGAIGTDGYIVPVSGELIPPYAAVAPTGKSDWTWAYKVTDTRAVQQTLGDSRLASCWYSATSFQVEFAFSDSSLHRVSFYFLDWDRAGREQTVEIIDKKTGAVLHRYTVANFGDGIYLDYNLSGNVIARVTRLKDSNATLSGIFFDAAAP